MTGDVAIQAGRPEPVEAVSMEKVVCDYCQCEFYIFHAKWPSPDSSRARNEAVYLKRDLLHGEHQDEKFKEHLAEYPLDDAEDFML